MSMFGNKLKKNNGFSRNDLGVRNPLSKVAIEHFLVFRGTLEGAVLRSSGFFYKKPRGQPTFGFAKSCSEFAPAELLAPRHRIFDKMLKKY